MTARIFIILAVLFFSCHGGQLKKQEADSLTANDSKVQETLVHNAVETCGIDGAPDIASSDYLIERIPRSLLRGGCLHFV